MEMERPGNPALRLFREAGGPGLVIPAEHGGLGATPLDAIRVQRAIGSRSPSLAVATTMHHFSLATLVEMAAAPNASGTEWLVLEGVARKKLYVASGFAEGRTGTGIFTSQFLVRRTPEGLILSGSKKPCSLSASMDLLTASVLLTDDAGQRLAVVLVPSAAPGISVRPFWGSSVLSGAESDEVVLDEVFVSENMLTYWGKPGQLDAVQQASFLWFELLITASYLGIASALVERVLAAARGTPVERVALAIETESAMTGLEGIAREMTVEPEQDLLAKALLVRFAVQQAIERVTAHAAELLGGMAFVSSPDVACLFASARALAFHPPSRLSAAAGLVAHLSGESFRVE
jgi:alkylation response protein AidB-like acyl-CoA dehydrogenase